MSRESKSVWAKRIERLKSSELTVKEFAAEIGVNDRTLSYWKWKLAKETGPVARPPRGVSRARASKPRARAQKPAPKFVEVTPAWIGGDTPIELVVAERYVIRVPVGFEAETLRRVMSVLEVGA